MCTATSCAPRPEQLIRIWRDESEIDTAHGRRRQAEWGNQIVRFTNTEAENIRFTAGHAAAHFCSRKASWRKITLLRSARTLVKRPARAKPCPASARTSPGCILARWR